MGATCGTAITSTNTNATVPHYSQSYSIPYKTPFELTAPIATDATEDMLTYCWEERDKGDYGSSLAQTHLAGPLFRSYLPDTARTRVFPRIQALLGKVPLIGEKLPDTARRLTFKVLERDIYQGWGAFNYADDTIKLDVINTTVPFSVTSPAGGETYAARSVHTVTWNVSGTSAAPISCANVDILIFRRQRLYLSLCFKSRHAKRRKRAGYHAEHHCWRGPGEGEMQQQCLLQHFTRQLQAYILHRCCTSFFKRTVNHYPLSPRTIC